MANTPWDGSDRRNQDDSNLLNLTADIVAAHVSNNVVAVNDLPQLITNVRSALGGLGGPPPVAKQEPMVSVRTSVKPDYIACLECGIKGTIIKRHLMTHHALTPAEYRAKWSLPADYPMTAPNYSKRRRELAIELGLGSKLKKRKTLTTK